MKWYSPLNPFAYWRKARHIWRNIQEKRSSRQYESDCSAWLAEQEAVYARLGLARHEALLVLRQQIEKDVLLVPFLGKLDLLELSEHWVFFAALQNSGISIRNFLV
jgi:hypothetical protein